MTRPGLSLAAAAGGERMRGRQAWALLWRSSRTLSWLVIACMAVTALAPALVVVALGRVVGAIPGAVEHGLGSPQGHRLLADLGVAAAAYGASLMLDPISSALSGAANARVTLALQGRLLRAVSGPVGIAHLEDREVLDRLARAEGSLSGFFPGSAPVSWAQSVATRLSGVIGCLAIAAYRWWLGLALLVVWYLARRYVLAAVLRQATDLRGQSETLRRAWYYAALGTKARDAKESRVFGLRDFIVGRFAQEHWDAIRGGVPALRRLHLRVLCCACAIAALFALALLMLADGARDGAIGVGALATLLPMLAVTSSLGSISMDDVSLAWTMAALPDVDLLEAQLLRDRPQTGIAAAGPGPGAPAERPQVRRAVAFEDVRFRYPGAEREVLQGIDLQLPAGRSTALVGINGAGKSTLVSLLSRLRDPTAGRITLDGADLRDLDPRSWQRAVALVSQEPVRFPVSAYDNIALGAIEHRADAAGVRAAAERAGFAEVVDALPDGWDTVLSRQLPGGAELSGGQWQRLALARALFATAHGAQLLVLDEPTAAMDVRSEALFYRQFLDITAGLTTVVISHRFATVRQADAICVLSDGRITERGTHEELVAAAGEYARMYSVQAERFAGAGRQRRRM